MTTDMSHKCPSDCSCAYQIPVLAVKAQAQARRYSSVPEASCVRFACGRVHNMPDAVAAMPSKPLQPSTLAVSAMSWFAL